MKYIWNDLVKWSVMQKTFVMARVVETWKSAPRKPGSVMLIDKEMHVVGSVSGGCIEGAVIQEAQGVMETGRPSHVHYGIEDETAWSVGLSCGGEVQVLIEKHWSVSDDPVAERVWNQMQECVNENKSIVLLTQVSPTPLAPMMVDERGNTEEAWPTFDEELKRLSLEILKAGKSQIQKWQQYKIFFHVMPAIDQMLIIGAGHISIALIQLAHQMEFETIVMDPRSIFTNRRRFDVSPTRLITEWPHEILKDWPLHKNLYVVFLTHDPKIDDPALHLVLKEPVAYIGALGSHRTHAKRCQRLKENGFSEEDIKKIHAPVGVDIGAETPSEIALSILAEIIQVKRKAR
ncbi:MAG: XdhC family protein [SAR324 cluster bacterium]|nr:XdhC family protein [SAR324 cluster bacterium]